MKKGLVILIALTFVAGVVFAEEGEATMMKLADPAVTFGVTSYAGIYAAQDNTVFELKDGSADSEAVSEVLFGGLASDSSYWSGYRYLAQPWVKLASGIFSVKFAPIFYGYSNAPSGTIAAPFLVQENSLTRLETTFGIAGSGFSLEDRVRYDNYKTNAASWTYHRVRAGVSMDNLSTDVVFDGKANNMTNVIVLDDFFAPFRAMNITDYQIKIKDLWGFASVKVGGLSTSYFHTNDFRYEAIDWFSSHNHDYASNNVQGIGFRWVGSTTMIPIQTTYNIGNLIEGIPLTIRTGFKVPVAAMEYRDYFTANNWIVSAQFAMEGVGKFNVGAIPGIAYTSNAFDGTSYTKATTNASNAVFVEANISAVENLQLQAAFDYGTMTMPSADPAATTGTGAAATPFVTAKVTATGIAFGLEAIYDLGAVLKGLEVDGGIAVTSLTGLTDLNTSGTAYVPPTAGAGTYIAANYNEASKHGAPENFIFGVGVSYAIDDNNSVSFSDNFTNMAGDFGDLDTAAGVTSYGFYSQNDIGLGYSVTAGKGKLSASLGYSMFLGLPAASDYGITGVDAIAAYDVALANTFKPFSVKLKYYATF
jgi:hypothetical protein